jgi:hypothetical protein
VQNASFREKRFWLKIPIFRYNVGMAIKTATPMGITANNYRGVARVYRMNPPIKEDETEYEYVLISKIRAPFTGPETYMFPCTKEGTIIQWREMDASRHGEWTHEQILAEAGYEIVNGVERAIEVLKDDARTED